MNNISIIRDPDTLKILGFAPIYDSGNSMFYNIPFEQLDSVRINDIKTHSFIEREVKLLSYVQNRDLVDIEKAVLDFEIYDMDLVERRIRIPKLKELYNIKLYNLPLFQNGKNLWKKTSAT